MNNKLREHEYRLLDIIWAYEPMSSKKLVSIAGEELGWKPSTTYTVIKNLSCAGYVENVNSVVRSLVSREQVQRVDSAEIVSKRFGGSLPRFVATFISSEGMSVEDAREISEMLSGYLSSSGCETA